MDGIITSPTNPKVKRLVRLRTRRYRDTAGVFLIEGFRELSRAADTATRIDELYVCEDLFLGANERALVNRIVSAGARCQLLAPTPFRKVAYRDRPEGLLAVAPQFDTSLAGLDPPEDALLLVAEAIEKPGNLGTMLRTADAAGAAAVVVADPATDPYNPNVVRASLGSLFTRPAGRRNDARGHALARREGHRPHRHVSVGPVEILGCVLRGTGGGGDRLGAVRPERGLARRAIPGGPNTHGRRRRFTQRLHRSRDRPVRGGEETIRSPTRHPRPLT